MFQIVNKYYKVEIDAETGIYGKNNRHNKLYILGTVSYNHFLNDFTILLLTYHPPKKRKNIDNKRSKRIINKHYS